eukprot:15446636-Alexandrium_andersonii.AAC.1
MGSEPRLDRDRRASETRARFERLLPDLDHEFRESLGPFVDELQEVAAHFDRGEVPLSGQKLVLETKRD